MQAARALEVSSKRLIIWRVNANTIFPEMAEVLIAIDGTPRGLDTDPGLGLRLKQRFGQAQLLWLCDNDEQERLFYATCARERFSSDQVCVPTTPFEEALRGAINS